MSELSKNRRESRRALGISIAVHVVVVAGLVELLLVPNRVRGWLHFGGTPEPRVVEHLQYIAPQGSAGSPVAPPTSRARTRPSEGGPPPVRLVAPPSVPTTLPPKPSTATPEELPSVTTGPVAGIGGPGHGARPEYYGPKVWVGPAPPGPSPSAPRTEAERVDSAMKHMISEHNDSLAMLGPHKQPGDWTVEHNGKKYGIDQQYIHLGPISIPTAVLAALPLNNITGNPIASQNEKLLNQRYDDIQYQANRRLNDEEFNKQVKEERLRKERERQAQQKDKQQQKTPSDQSAPVAAAQQ